MIQKGRNWVDHGNWSDRHDGYWIGNYWAWTPLLSLTFVAIAYRLLTGDNNFFYNPTRRSQLRISDEELFGG